jgi:glycosyltransferase involved in cell wall biosynthesis
MNLVDHAPERRLRICLLHNYRESQQISMMLYADRLGSALQRQGAEVERVSPPPVLSSNGQLWLLDKLDSYLGRFVRYPRIAHHARADVYHVVDHGQAFLTASLEPRRTVVTCHDMMLLVAASGRLGRRPELTVAVHVFREISTFLGQAAAIVADSENTRRDILRYLNVDPGRIEVIPPGLNQPFAPDPELRELGRRRWRLGDDKVILQLGNAFYKNVEACLDVVAELRRQGLPVTLIRARQRLGAPQRARAERLGIAGFVRDLGALDDADLPMLYNAADILLFPSYYEGFGWPPLEAMASGTPVVCSRSGSLAEVSAPAALTCDPEDVSRLASHVAAVLTDPRLAESMRARGLAHASQFRWDSTARRMMALYRRVQEAA